MLVLQQLSIKEMVQAVEFSTPVNNIVQAKDKLLAAGVSTDQIYIINLPDLSLSPAARKLANGNKALLSLFKVISEAFNTKLRWHCLIMSFILERIFLPHIFFQVSI